MSVAVHVNAAPAAANAAMAAGIAARAAQRRREEDAQCVLEGRCEVVPKAPPTAIETGFEYLLLTLTITVAVAAVLMVATLIKDLWEG